MLLKDGNLSRIATRMHCRARPAKSMHYATALNLRIILDQAEYGAGRCVL
jgi:hypothetical protein